MGTHSSREIRSRIFRRMDLWERGLHAVLVGGTEVEGSAREGMFARVGEEEE